MQLHAALLVGCLMVGLGAAGVETANAAQSLFSVQRHGQDSGAEGTHYELGTIFRSDVPGRVSKIRVYSLATESGIHTARLWRNSNGALVGGPWLWNYGGTNGWIELEVDDVTIEPNTDYTISVSTGGGGRNYPILSFDLNLAGGNGRNLTYPAGAGVFSTVPGSRPTQTFQNANYFRDVVFVDDSSIPTTNGPVTISEFLADNVSGLRDEEGDASDWVELFNPSDSIIDLAGYTLSDSQTNWVFPSVKMAPRQYLVVFASGKDRSSSAGPLHTSFRLDKAGEYLGLKDAAGKVLSEFAPLYPRQQSDLSAGMGTNGSVIFFVPPTPGNPNIGRVYSGFVDAPDPSVSRGVYDRPFSLTLTSATPDVVIRYTEDGSIPSETSGKVYAGGVEVSKTTTLRVRAFREGYAPSKLITLTYLFLRDVIQQTAASAQTSGWPLGPISGQELRLGIKPALAALYSNAQMLDGLKQIPSISIVTDQMNLTDPARGLYVNAASEGPAWERPVSIELIHPDGAKGFQVDCGLRIRGGQSSSSRFPKHSFHVFFRGEYGNSRLDYPLFGRDAATTFETIDLRCEHGYAYADPYPYSDEFTAVRDVFCRELWAAAGYASTRSKPYHLYLNGQYWGLYQTQERAQEDYAATYWGGASDEFDVIKASGLPQLTMEVSSGDSVEWFRLWSGARAVAKNPTDQIYYALLGRNADGSRNPTLPVLLEPRELAAYMLLHYYTGHADEPLSVSFNWEKPNNFRAIRRRGLEEPWHFFVHDGESSMMAPEWFDNRANAVNLTSLNRTNFVYSNPEWIHEDLMAHPDYRTTFWDEAQRLLLGNGAMTPTNAQGIWDRLAAEIDQAVIGESIRWGQDPSKARQSVWAARIASVRTNFFPSRSARLITQLRQRNQYPSVVAPSVNRVGGSVPAGFGLTITNAGLGGTVYYSLDGVDPRLPGGGIHAAARAYVPGELLVINGVVRLRARVWNNRNWSALVSEDYFPLQDFTQLELSEIMYHPMASGSFAGDSLEFIEFKNGGTNSLDLSGVHFTEGITFQFTNGASLAPGQFLVLGRDRLAMAARYPQVQLYGLYSGKLDNSGERLTLVHPLGNSVFSIAYGTLPPWPITADGWGFSIVPRSSGVSGDSRTGGFWSASAMQGGSPGQEDPPPQIPSVYLNEVFTRASNPLDNALELFNPNLFRVNVGGWFLSDDALNPTKYAIPAGALIEPGGFWVVTAAQLSAGAALKTNAVTLRPEGGAIYLFSADAVGRLTGYSHGFSFGGGEQGMSLGRFLTSQGEERLVPQQSVSLGQTNPGPALGSVLIREIMYHPPDLSSDLDDPDSEYIELSNTTGFPVTLFDPEHPTQTWLVRGGVSFDFPPAITLAPRESVVLVHFDPIHPLKVDEFRGKYPQFSQARLWGPYSGKLDNHGDAIRLTRPGLPSGSVIPRILVDEIIYADASPWPASADGSGSSLRRLDPSGYGGDPVNWSAITPLTITSQPLDLTVRLGYNAVFSISAYGEGTLSYQWRLNGVDLSDDERVSGAQTASLQVSNVQANLLGEYAVVMRDARQEGTSLKVRLQILSPPTILSQPRSQTVVENDMVTLSVQVTNTATLPIRYEWRLGQVGLQTNVVHAHSNSYNFRASTMIAPITNAYRVVLRNAANSTPGVGSSLVQVVVLRDSDSDHLPDDWTLQYFGHIEGRVSDLSRSEDDFDGDGMINLDEFRAGTDPKNGASLLKFAFTREKEGVAIRFEAQADRVYRLESARDLEDATWQVVADVTEAPTNRVIQIKADLSETRRFFRVSIPMQP